MTHYIQDNMRTRAPKRGYFFNEGMACGACPQGERRKSSARINPVRQRRQFLEEIAEASLANRGQTVAT